MFAQIYYFLFGLVSIAGGAMGYTSAKSKASLIAGGVSGALLIIAGLLPRVPGFVLALIVSILLLTHFGLSYAAKKKPMPAIPMIALSGICIVLTAIAWHTS